MLHEHPLSREGTMTYPNATRKHGERGVLDVVRHILLVPVRPIHSHHHIPAALQPVQSTINLLRKS